MEVKRLTLALMCCPLMAALAQSKPDSRPANSTAIVEPRGFVTINGENIKDMQPLFSGDKVRTGEKARAIIEFRLATATVAANSCVTYAPNFVEITCGATLIRTKAKTTALICDLSVLPTDQDAEYVASLTRDYVVVISKRGSQMLDSGKEHIALPAGATFTRARAEMCRHR